MSPNCIYCTVEQFLVILKLPLLKSFEVKINIHASVFSFCSLWRNIHSVHCFIDCTSAVLGNIINECSS